ncbi:hypothetical protein PR001_g17895 [Phytophthora rubi]|uniref:ZSWIM1/3 RNaseH-like domain-containing protein n=1 Tax=Phytophthora rubi TaxID=129364 RepID=A0A6A3K7X5_9STRA|nr:hypothetical protein PR001_g17895 [Phytophthora rubi]
MERIMDFFKQRNPTWKKIKTIVIDKDFVEWRVLEKAFLNAKVLLCQFHALDILAQSLQKSYVQSYDGAAGRNGSSIREVDVLQYQIEV